MSKVILFVFLFAILIVNLTASTRGLQENIQINEQPIKIGQQKQKHYIEDPFVFPNPNSDDKPYKHHKGKFDKHRIQQAQMRGIYEPFSFDDNEQKPRKPERQHRREREEHNEDQEQQDQQHERENRRFNRMLGWGLFLGSIFLAFVLIKTCISKRGRRQQRQHRQCMRNSHNQQATIVNPHQQFYQSYPQNESQKIEQQIKSYQNQINKLKAAQQQILKREFNIKKIEEQRKTQMMNLQREQQFVPRRHPNFGPQYYYAGGQYYNTENSFNQPQQPFVVRGVEPIKRQRSNSFKTELSQMPILKNQIKYKNGIPIGKPLKNHDNDSSFASQYPEV